MTDAPVMTKRYTVEEFEAYIALPEHADRRFELIDGEVVEKMPTELHSLLGGNLYFAFRLFLRTNELGQITYETRHRASKDDIHNDRIPDLSFTRKERLLPVVERGAVPQIPDLCIEIQSPDDYPKHMREKAAYYLANGAQQVWLIFTKKPLIEVMYPNGESDFYYPGDTLVGGALLPGFAIEFAQIYAVRGSEANA